jgi:hypothetical protein
MTLPSVRGKGLWPNAKRRHEWKDVVMALAVVRGFLVRDHHAGISCGCNRDIYTDYPQIPNECRRSSRLSRAASHAYLRSPGHDRCSEVSAKSFFIRGRISLCKGHLCTVQRLFVGFVTLPFTRSPINWQYGLRTRIITQIGLSDGVHWRLSSCGLIVGVETGVNN